MIIQIRVDDRLIHGQIAVVWSKQFNTTHMVVANDKAAVNEVQQMALKMATPAGIKVLIRSVDDSIKIFNNPKSKHVKMFVLTNSVQDASRRTVRWNRSTWQMSVASTPQKTKSSSTPMSSATARNWRHCERSLSWTSKRSTGSFRPIRKLRSKNYWKM